MKQDNLKSSFPENEQSIPSAEQIDIGTLIRKWIRYWYWFLLGIVIYISLAYIYLKFTPFVYQVNATLQIKDDKNSGLSGMGDDILSQITMFSNSVNLPNEIIVLKSNTLVGQVVKDLGLQVEYLPSGVGRSARVDLYRNSPVKVIPLKWNGAPETTLLKISTKDDTHYRISDENSEHEVQTGQIAHLASGDFWFAKNPEIIQSEFKDLEVTVRPLNDAIGGIQKQLDIAPTDKMSSTLSLSFKTRVKSKGRDFLNELLGAYQNLGLKEKNLTASNTIAFVSTRLDSLMFDLNDVETELADFMSRNQIADIDEQGRVLIDQFAQISDGLTKKEIEMNVLSDLRKYIDQPVSDDLQVPSVTGIEDPSLIALIQQFYTLQLQLTTQLKSGLKEAHPMMQSLRHQTDELRKSISENIKNNEIVLRTVIQDLESQKNRFSGKISDVPKIQKQFLAINRQHEVKQELYKYLLQKREEASMTKESSVNNSYIVDPAEVLTDPVSPKRNFVYLAAFLLGILTPGGLLYVRDLLNTKIKSRKDISAVSSVPIYGEIMESKEKGRNIVVEPGIRKPIAEQFRNLRTNLNFVLNNTDEKVMIITSGNSGEGKSFISANLAVAFSLAEQRTVLLSFDLRRPKLEEYLGKREFGPGLSLFLSGDLEVKDIINTIPLNGSHELSFINSGIIPPNPAELIMRSKIEVLFEYLNKNFDRIIIDAPPIGIVSDPQILSKYSQATIWVMRYNYTYKEQIKMIDEYYRKNKLPRVGVVVNDIPVSEGYHYGYSYGYYAGYYGTSDDEKPSFFKRIFKK